MERLKEYYNADIGKRYLIYIPKEKDCIYIAGYKIDGFDSFENFCEYMKRFHDVEKELKAYKDLEEQGLLLRLPCKVGTKVWTIMTGMTGKHPMLFRQEFEVSMLEHWGKAVFLTKADAEKKLAEMGE